MRSAKAVRFEAGEGPRLDPISSETAIDALPRAVDQGVLAPIGISGVRVSVVRPSR